ncbi:hypothetical protein QBC45DRAFT_330722, partial [Copromyces sp. CBS 386.78]
IFKKLKERNISIRPLKSFYAFLFIIVLGYIINLFRLTTVKEKFNTITKLKFPKILKDLEIFIS